MNDSATSEKKTCTNTRRALLWMHVLNEPMTVLYTLLPFILVKDFGATAFELSVFISLRPILTFFSYFWGINLSRKKRNLLPNIMVTCVLAYLPFALLSLNGNIWFIILAAGSYQLFYRAGLPGWVEVLQQNLPAKTREQVFALSFVLGFLVSGTIGIFLGWLLDANPQSLRILLCVFSLIGLTNLFFLKKIPITESTEKKEHFVTALKESWHLIYKVPDFRTFQIAFMIGGGALMLISPSLSLFYVDVLALSHTQITTARFVFMALGVTGSSFFWKKGLQRFHLNALSIWILVGFGLFALCLLIATKGLFFLFTAFVFYGIAQSGSHLAWNLSGPFFAKENGSIPYTSVNLLMIGIRGVIFPFLGGALANVFDPQIVIGLGMLICFLGALVMKKHCKTSFADKGYYNL